LTIEFSSLGLAFKQLMCLKKTSLADASGLPGEARPANLGRVAEIKTSNSKLQYPEKRQAPNFKPHPIDVWSF